MAQQGYVSHELTHFVGRTLPTDNERFRLLVQILNQGWLRASHRERLGAEMVMLSDPRRKLSSNESVISTTVCFCDIPENGLGIHVGKYGPFGIAFPKVLLLRRGVSPVFYVAADASSSNLAPGIGARTLGERFDELYRDLATVGAAFDAYVWKREPEGLVPGLRMTYKLAPEGTPEGQRALGQLHALQSDLNRLVFSYLKFFTAELPHEHADNYYMEREWRMRDGLAFASEDVAALYMPPRFASELLTRHPEYEGRIRFVDSSQNTDARVTEGAE